MKRQRLHPFSPLGGEKVPAGRMRGATFPKLAPLTRRFAPPSPRQAGRGVIYVLAAIAIMFILPVAAHACTVCWGSPNDPMVKSVNKGIWVLLGFIGFVQVGFAALFFSFWRRARELRRFRESLQVIEGGQQS